MQLRHSKKAPTGRRAVVDSSRPAAFSYHANRTDQEYNLGRLQPRDQDVRRKEKLVRYWRQRLGVLVVGIVAICCLIDILHLSNTPRVVELTASGGSYFLQPTSVYQAAASKLFASSILNGNKITINTADITRKLKQQFPELSDVSVTLPLISHRPIVYIAPTTPSLLLTTARGTFLLDSTGKALITADQVSDVSSLSLPTVSDTSGVTIHSNEVALPSTSVNFIQTVAAEFKAKSIAIDSLTLPAAAYELDVKPAGVGYYVKFNLHSSDPLQQVGTYLAVEQRLGSQSITPASYIDVRLDGRAYYK